MKSNCLRKLIPILIVLSLIFASIPMGITGMTAFAEDADIVSSNGEEYYFNLDNGNYLVTSSGIITVNGESVASGTELNKPGQYTIKKTESTRVSTQNIILYRSNDVNSDNFVDVRDLIVLKKIFADDYSLSKASKQVIDINDDDAVDSTDLADMIELLIGKKDEIAKQNATNYNAGSETQMPIGGFWGPNDQTYSNTDTAFTTPNYISDQFYKLISDCGINLITYTSNTATPNTKRIESVKKELALAEKYGIGMFVSTNLTNSSTKQDLEEFINNFSAYDSFKGISIKDEPSSATYPDPALWASYNHTANDMSNYSNLAKLINKYTNLTGYVNLFPYWSNMGSTQNYIDYLNEYCKTFNPKQISFDYYVYNRGSITSCAEYFSNLDMVRAASKENNVPFWAYIQAGNDFRDDGNNAASGKRTPNEAQFKWNVNMSLAYGAKGIQYFPLLQPYYYSKDGAENDFGRNGIIGADGSTTNWYNYAKSMNQQIVAIDDVLMKSESKGVIATGTYAKKNVNGAAVINSYKELVGVTVPSNDYYGAVVGCFDYFGKTALYVVNYDTTKARNITLNYDGNHTSHIVSNKATLNSTGSSCTIALDAGEAALVLVDSITGAQQGKISNIVNEISNLSSLENVEMPKDYTAIMNANNAYSVLSNREKANIPEESKVALNKAISLTAGYDDLYCLASCDETLINGIDYKWDGVAVESYDEEYGNITEFLVESTNGSAQFVDQLLTVDEKYDNVEFYVYNPLERDVTGYYLHNWANEKAVNLASKAWTKVIIPASDYNGSVSFLTFYTDISCETPWMVTNMYGSNSSALPQAVVNMINALPYYSELTLDNQGEVEAARNAYNALSTDAKASVTNLSVLEQCEARMAYLISYAGGNLPVVVDASCQDLGTDGTLTKNVIDETYGKVYTLSGATHFTVPYTVKDESFRESKSVITYIYNPTDEDVDLSYNMEYWEDYNWFPRFAVLKAESWTRLEFSDCAAQENKQFVSNGTNHGTVYFNADFSAEGWKISSFYGMKEYGMPDVQNDTVVFDVTKNAYGCEDPNLAINVDDSTFGKVMTFGDVKYIALDNVNQTEEYASSNAAYLYIYNPTSSDVQGNFTIDWNYYGYYVLKANSWNRIYLADFKTDGDTYKLLTNGGTIYFDAAFTGPGWKVTSIYGIMDKTEEEEKEPTDTIVINAENVEYVADGGVVSGLLDPNYGYVNMISGSSYFVINNAMKTTEFRNSKTVYCYIYNPTSSDVSIYWTQDWCYKKYYLLKANSWTRVELSDVVNQAGSMILGDTRTIWCYGEFSGTGWKITSFYGVNDFKADNIENGLIVADAENALGVDGTITPRVADTTFDQVQSFENSTYIALTERCKLEGFHDSKAVAFYVYNPTSSDVNGRITSNWGYYAYYTLKANSWNRIYLTNEGGAEGNDFVSTTSTVYFYSDFAGSGWKVSPFYRVEY